MSEFPPMQADPGMIFQSTKTYTHSVGLSCCFRQWRAIDSHCRFLHGYALEVKFTFQALATDDRNWVQDFGGLKRIKQWLEENFDHKTLVAKDDPDYRYFADLRNQGIIDMNVVDHVGCEALAKMIFDAAISNYPQLYSVEVREHAGNSAIYKRHD